MLPEQFEYWPPLIVNHIDCSCKKERTIGMAIISKSKKFYIESTLPCQAKEITIETSDVGGFSFFIFISKKKYDFTYHVSYRYLRIV